MMELLIEEKEENKKLKTYLKSKVPDISNFFPLKNAASVERFLDESDGLFHLRYAEFENMFGPCIHKKKNIFGTSLLNAFFSDEFVKTYSWPTHR